MRIFLVFLFLTVLGAPAFAKTGKDCAGIDDDNKRLLCYDLLFKITEIAPQKTHDNWEVSVKESKIDDSKTVLMATRNTETIIDKFGKRKDIALLIACRENRTSLWIAFDTFMADHAGGGVVTYRVDKQDAARITFRESNDNSALGLWTGGRSIPFIRKLAGKSQLLIRATPFNESQITPIFNITGIEEAIKPLTSACGWKM